MSYRITRVLCPECEGEGRSWLGSPCPLCLGERKVSRSQLIDRSLLIGSLGSSGYIEGDLDYDDLMKYRKHADNLRALAKEMDDGSMV